MNVSENSEEDYSDLSEHSEESSEYGEEEDGEGDSEEESGKDWSELEEEARQGKILTKCPRFLLFKRYVQGFY